MTFVRANPLGWAFLELLTSTQMNQIDSQMPFALDGNGGGTYTPVAGIELDGTVMLPGTPLLSLTNNTTAESLFIENAVGAANAILLIHHGAGAAVEIETELNTMGIDVQGDPVTLPGGVPETMVLIVGHENDDVAINSTGGIGLEVAGGEQSGGTSDGGIGIAVEGGATNAVSGTIQGGPAVVGRGGDATAGAGGGQGLIGAGGDSTVAAAGAGIAALGGTTTGAIAGGVGIVSNGGDGGASAIGGVGLVATGGIGIAGQTAIIATAGAGTNPNGTNAIIGTGEADDGTNGRAGGGVVGQGGSTTTASSLDIGGPGIQGIGGAAATIGIGGEGGLFTGGASSTGTGGAGIEATGGTSTSGPQGSAIIANGVGNGIGILVGAGPTVSGLGAITVLNTAVSGTGHGIISTLSGGDGAAIALHSSSSGAHILFANSGSTPGTLVDGMEWWIGGSTAAQANTTLRSPLRIRINGATYVILVEAV